MVPCQTDPRLDHVVLHKCRGGIEDVVARNVGTAREGQEVRGVLIVQVEQQCEQDSDLRNITSKEA